MTRARFVSLLAAPALAVGLIAVGGALSGANDPPKVVSVEDKVREVMRRLDKLEGERAELTKRADAAEAALEQERADRKADLDKANARIDAAAAQAKLDRIPLGAMIPYFGARLPEGYRRCNGNAKEDYPNRDNVYPDASWVPKHLVGEPLPDMREHLVGGAKDEAAVGRVWDKGKIPGSKTNAAEMGRSPAHPSYPKNPLMAMVVPESVGTAETYLHVNHYFVRIPIPALGDTELKTAATNPRHVMCHWIIRVE